jgi:hypothetical protein
MSLHTSTQDPSTATFPWEAQPNLRGSADRDYWLNIQGMWAYDDRGVYDDINLVTRVGQQVESQM